MIFRVRYEMKGRHVHCALFCGPNDKSLAKSGDLVMSPEDFDHFAWLVRGRFEFDPPTRFVGHPSASRTNGIANRILDQIRVRLTPDEYAKIFWVITTALDDSFDLGVTAAGGTVVEDGGPRGYIRVEPPKILRASEIAADWFTLPPNMRTKARLLEMLENNGEYA